MANRTWVDGDVGIVEIVSPKFGVFLCKVDQERMPELSNLNWSVHGGNYKTPRYAVTSWRKEDGSPTTKTMHQFLFPECPSGLVRDHINGDGFDNRRTNIRFVTCAHNSLNRKNRKLKQGVALTKGVYRAHFTVGYFKTEDEAHEAWKSAYLKVNGELPACIA